VTGSRFAGGRVKIIRASGAKTVGRRMSTRRVVDMTTLLVDQQIERARDFADKAIVIGWVGYGNELKAEHGIVDGWAQVFFDVAQTTKSSRVNKAKK
jgi:hypothetical protein